MLTGYAGVQIGLDQGGTRSVTTPERGSDWVKQSVVANGLALRNRTRWCMLISKREGMMSSEVTSNKWRFQSRVNGW